MTVEVTSSRGAFELKLRGDGEVTGGRVPPVARSGTVRRGLRHSEYNLAVCGVY